MLSLSCHHSPDHQEGADSPEEEAKEEAFASLRHVVQTGDSNLAEFAKLLNLHPMSTTATMSECNRWTKKDVEDLRVMMCEMNLEPDMFPDSASETEQD